MCSFIYCVCEIQKSNKEEKNTIGKDNTEKNKPSNFIQSD